MKLMEHFKSDNTLIVFPRNMARFDAKLINLVLGERVHPDCMFLFNTLNHNERREIFLTLQKPVPSSINFRGGCAFVWCSIGIVTPKPARVQGYFFIAD